jgi:hypothetical protein
MKSKNKNKMKKIVLFWCEVQPGAYLDLLIGRRGESKSFLNSGSKFTSKIFGNI